MSDLQDYDNIGGLYDRHALVAAINDVLQAWHAEHGQAGGALFALDALGYITGSIFRQAPDTNSHAIGRTQFMSAMEDGIGQRDIGSLN
jgi:hypothetical protein